MERWKRAAPFLKVLELELGNVRGASSKSNGARKALYIIFNSIFFKTHYFSSVKI